VSKKGGQTPAQGSKPYANEHCVYSALSKPDRRALRDVLSMAFPIGKSSHRLWSDFPDTTAFVRRIREVEEGDPPEGILGGAIVMSYPEDQYDYLAYIAIHPEYRHRRRLFARSGEPHHGTELLRYVYDVMRRRVSPSRLQRYLMIEPAGDAALRFYVRALPSNEYPVKFYEPDRVISVGYDGLAL
jgi:hypothetical protein